MSSSSSRLIFPPFQFDPAAGLLWRGRQQRSLKPQAAAVLHYLIEHSEEVVSKAELLAALWPDITVGEGIVKTALWEIRRALGDHTQKPRFIETIPRRGYRFIAPVTTQPIRSLEFGVRSRDFRPAPSTQPPAPSLVGRETELTQLHGWLDKALNGERQIVFVTGEAGIGKTALIEAFLFGVQSQKEFGVRSHEKFGVQKATSRTLNPELPPTPNSELPSTPSPWIGRGQCVEQYGTGEAYMPVLEALGRICRTSGGKRLIRLLHRHAPTWLAQMPALLSVAERQQLQREIQGVTQGRMLREMAEAVEVLTNDHPLILLLEDLHWSDVSTLDLLTTLARRREQARLLVIGTYRPVAVPGDTHPLSAIGQELLSRGLCVELPLGSLSEAAVGEYVAQRFVGETWSTRPLQNLAQIIYQRTEGNPLFIVSIVEYLLAQEEEPLTQATLQAEHRLTVVPQNVRQMIEKQFERLHREEQRVLEVASVAGIEFSAATVAAAAETETIEVEETCKALAQRHLFLTASGARIRPERREAQRYRFQHVLYQNVVHEQLTAARQRRLHQRVGEWKETAYGRQARTFAAELAMHFERGRDLRRAIYYLRQAGENANRRSAHSEAVNLFTKGLELLQTLPYTPERTQQEIQLHLARGAPLITLRGYASPEVEHSYSRAYKLCQQIREPRYLFPAVLGLCGVRHNQAEFRKTRVLAQQLLRLARNGNDPTRLLWAHVFSGTVLHLTGKFVLAQQHFVEGITLYDTRRHGPHASDVVQDPGVHCRCYLAEVLWMRGYADQARQLCHQALSLARQLAHSHSTAVALSSASLLHNWFGEQQTAQDLAEELITLTHEHGFPLWLAVGTLRQGWALAKQGWVAEGITQMRQGIAAFQATDTKQWFSLFSYELAWAHGRAGRPDEGLTLLAEAQAMMDSTGERLYEAELYRLKGELLLNDEYRTLNDELQISSVHRSSFRIHHSEEAKACFLKAITIARRQQAKSLELRATISLARLWQRQGKKQPARQLLSKLYSQFTEGFDTVDLKEAKGLLEELSH